VDFLVFEPLLMEGGFGEVAGEFPGGHVGEVVIVAAGFAFVLVFHAEVSTAAFFAVEGVAAEEAQEEAKREGEGEPVGERETEGVALVVMNGSIHQFRVSHSARPLSGIMRSYRALRSVRYNRSRL
jgi:hypothetical protein